MPPIGSERVDELGQILLGAWICELGSCGGGGDTLAPPQNLRGSVYSQSALELFWDRNNTLVNYQITRDGVVVKQTNGISFFDSGLDRATSYDIDVVGIDANGQRTSPSSLTLTTNN